MAASTVRSILFEQLGLRQIVLKNTVWLSVGEGTSRLFTTLLFIYAARKLGPEEFGVFSFVLAIVTMIAVLSDFGFSDITTRELAQKKESKEEYSAILLFRVLASLAVLLFILLVVLFFSFSAEAGHLIIILGLYTLGNNLLMAIYAFFRAGQRMEFEAIAKVFQGVLIGGAGFFAISQWPSASVLGYSLFGATVLTLLFAFGILHVFVQNIGLAWAPGAWKRLLKVSWPLGLAMVFGVIYIRIDSVMMGLWGQIAEVGWYNAAYRLMGFSVVPMMLISTSFYPVLAKALKDSQERFQRTWNSYMGTMILLAVPLVVGGFIVAPELIVFLYTTEYKAAILAFQLLIFVAGLNFLFYPYVSALVIGNHQGKHLRSVFIGALVNVLLNFLLIPRFSLYGAAVATIITYVVILVLNSIFAGRFMGVTLFNANAARIFFAALGVSAVMALSIHWTSSLGLHIVTQILLAVVLYSFGVYVLYRKQLFFL